MNNYLKTIKDSLSKLYKLRDLTAVGTATIVSTGISGIFWLYLASLLGTEGYGQLSYLIAIAGTTSVLASLGSENTLIVYRAKAVTLQATIFCIVLISGLIASVALFFVTDNASMSFYPLGYIIFHLSIAELLGRKLYKNYSIVIIIQRISMVGLALLFYHFLGINGIILGYAISQYPYLVIVIRGFKESKINLKLLKPRLGFMMNNYFLDLLHTLGSYVDKLIIFPLFGAVILGNYALGYQILAITSLAPLIVYQYVLPHDATGQNNQKLKKLTIIITVFIVILTIILAPYVIPILFNEFDQSVEIVQIMSLNAIPGSFALMYKSEFLGKEKSKIVLIGSGLSLLTVILGVLILSTYLKIHGAALAIVLAAVVEAIYYYLMKHKKIHYTSND